MGFIKVAVDKVDSLSKKMFIHIKCFEDGYSKAFSLIVFLLVFVSFVFGGFVGFLWSTVSNVPPKEVGFVVAAVVAAIVGLLVSETNKESEIGKHREKWLESLKEEVSEYSAKCLSYGFYGFKEMLSVTKNPENQENIVKDNDFDFVKNVMEMRGSYYRISLFVRSRDKNKEEYAIYDQARDMLSVAESYISFRVSAKKGEEMDLEKHKDAVRGLHFSGDKLIHLLKEYSDKEWDKIKRGHVWFRLKRALFSCFLFFVVAFFTSYSNFYYEGHSELKKERGGGVSYRLEVWQVFY